jgi:CheY-like chemotaxis protein
MRPDNAGFTHREAKRTINNPPEGLQLDLSPMIYGRSEAFRRKSRKQKAQLRAQLPFYILWGLDGSTQSMIDSLPTPMRIGLVDDDLSVRKAMSRLLRSQGSECVTYESAEAALADPQLLETDCLILDIELPDMNGFELRDYLIERGSSIPHLFVTAHAEDDFSDWNTRMGNSPYLRKPFNEIQLIELINKVIAWRSGC